MTRINTNMASLVGLHRLGRANRSMQTSLQRLSSGLRIDAAKDDPAGLIVSELLRSEMTGVRQAIDNTERANNVIATAEGALNEVSSLLNDIRDLVVEAASTGAMTHEEIRANQLQVDSAIDTIDRIANSTTFGGKRLLNGSMDFNRSVIADLDNALADIRIDTAMLGPSGAVDLDFEIDQAARSGDLDVVHSDGSGYTLEVAGTHGVMTYTVADHANRFALTNTLAEMINATSDQTNVYAATGGGTLWLRTEDKGSSEFVRARVVSGTNVASVGWVAGATSGFARGTDTTGTIDGQAFVGDGFTAAFNTGTAKGEITFDETNAMNGSAGTIRIDGGGALFQIGQRVGATGQVHVGLHSVTSSSLGDAFTDGVLASLKTGGENDLFSPDIQDASEAVDAAILQVARMRGRLGALQRNTLETNVNSLQVSLENLTGSESSIRDTDFAAETANLTRGQILVQAATSVLATANATPRGVLRLLG